MTKDNKKGFTLIELLVVIAIIGILSSIVLVSLGNARQKARDAKKQADLTSIATALALYADDNNGNFPAPDTNCTGVASCLPPTTSSLYATYLKGGRPLEPGTNNDYLYYNNGTDVTYCIQSSPLENKPTQRVFCDSGGCRLVSTSQTCQAGTTEG